MPIEEAVQGQLYLNNQLIGEIQEISLKEWDTHVFLL